MPRTRTTHGPRLVLTDTEERFPRAASTLMSGAFPILLLNSAFGLLPSTLVGPNLTYRRCSLAQLYAIVFGLAILILSGLFVPVMLTYELSKETNGTKLAVILLTKLTHVGGFLLLLVRGHFVARRLPEVWRAASRLVERGGLVKRRSLWWVGVFSTFTYFSLMVAFQLDVFQGQLYQVLPKFVAYYGIFPPSQFDIFLITSGYVIWSLVSFSHVLVSILASYLLSVVHLSLRSLNATLLPLAPRSSLLASVPDTETHYHRGQKRGLQNWNSASALVKDVIVLAEEVVGECSSTLGVSLIIEVLILISNMLVDIFYVILTISPKKGSSSGDNGNLTSWSNDDILENGGGGGGAEELWAVDFVGTYGPGGTNDAFRLIIEAAIHFHFFYKLCCVSTHVVLEASRSLQILKTLRRSDIKGGRSAWLGVEEAKGDLSTANVSLSAANYFNVNKFLLTSVTGALTTYIIVLLQFNAQDGGR